MTRIIMCGCNGAMGRMITGIVNEDAEAEIVAGIDMVDTKEHCYPVFQKLADCDVEADALIDELLSLENPYNCPHGRPTIISMTKYELEKKFKRIV